MGRFGSAVILAGGKSKRMGYDKQLLMINEKRLIISQMEKLKREFHDIIIVTNSPSYYSDTEGTAVIDDIKGKGPLGGIHTGLKYAESDFVYFIACDMPIINFSYIRFVKQELNNNRKDAAVAKQGDYIEPFNAFYNKSLIPKIEEYLKITSLSVQKFLNSMDCMYIEEDKARKYSSNWDMFLNLNTKDDVLKYLSR